MSGDFIEMINDIDFLYGFICECAYLVNNLYDHYNYDHLAIKLYCNFVLPITNITKAEHIKEYNEHVKDSKYINSSYLIDICFERYFELSRDEYSKIKKFIDNNIDTFESILALIHDFVDLYKKSYNNYRYYPFNFHSIKNYDECVCIIGKYSEICENDNYVLKSIAKSYFNVEYIKFFYLLQKVTKLSISNINSRILKNMFINLYDNSNTDCNEKVESKIYDLYREIMPIIISNYKVQCAVILLK